MLLNLLDISVHEKKIQQVRQAVGRTKDTLSQYGYLARYSRPHSQNIALSSNWFCSIAILECTQFCCNFCRFIWFKSNWIMPENLLYCAAVAAESIGWSTAYACWRLSFHQIHAHKHTSLIDGRKLKESFINFRVIASKFICVQAMCVCVCMCEY